MITFKPKDIVYYFLLQVFISTLQPWSSQNVLSVEYSDFVDAVFFKPSEYSISLHRPNIDQEINLIDETKPVFVLIYNLSENELKVLNEYIEDYLEKGFIQLSISFIRSLVLFSKISTPICKLSILELYHD